MLPLAIKEGIAALLVGAMMLMGVFNMSNATDDDVIKDYGTHYVAFISLDIDDADDSVEIHIDKRAEWEEAWDYVAFYKNGKKVIDWEMDSAGYGGLGWKEFYEKLPPEWKEAADELTDGMPKSKAQHDEMMDYLKEEISQTSNNQ